MSPRKRREPWSETFEGARCIKAWLEHYKTEALHLASATELNVFLAEMVDEAVAEALEAQRDRIIEFLSDEL